MRVTISRYIRINIYKYRYGVSEVEAVSYTYHMLYVVCVCVSVLVGLRSDRFILRVLCNKRFFLRATTKTLAFLRRGVERKRKGKTETKWKSETKSLNWSEEERIPLTPTVRRSRSPQAKREKRRSLNLRLCVVINEISIFFFFSLSNRITHLRVYIYRREKIIKLGGIQAACFVWPTETGKTERSSGVGAAAKGKETQRPLDEKKHKKKSTKNKYIL